MPERRSLWSETAAFSFLLRNPKGCTEKQASEAYSAGRGRLSKIQAVGSEVILSVSGAGVGLHGESDR